jgi:hypothetical protein
VRGDARCRSTHHTAAKYRSRRFEKLAAAEWLGAVAKASWNLQLTELP